MSFIGENEYNFIYSTEAKLKNKDVNDLYDNV